MTTNLPTRAAPVGSAIADASLSSGRREPVTAAEMLILVRESLRDHGHPTTIDVNNIMDATYACRSLLEALRLTPPRSGGTVAPLGEGNSGPGGPMPSTKS